MPVRYAYLPPPDLDHPDDVPPDSDHPDGVKSDLPHPYVQRGQFTQAVTNMHGHQRTCHQLPQGKLYCRMCMARGHPVPHTRVVELKEPKQSSSGVAVTTSAPARPWWACPSCWNANDVADRNLSLDVEPPDEERIALDRALSFELARPSLAPDPDHLPNLEHDKSLLGVLAMTEEHIQAMSGADCVAYVMNIVAFLTNSKWLDIDEVPADVTAVLHHVDPRYTAGGPSSTASTESDREEFARMLLSTWRGMACRNSLFTECHTVISTELSCNHNSVPLGSGHAAKAADHYMCKYMIKEGTQLNLSIAGLSAMRNRPEDFPSLVPPNVQNELRRLADVREHIEKYPSKADDTGTARRTTIHFMQRALIKAEDELAPMQMAAIVLGMPSSGQAEDTVFVYPYDAMRLLRGLHTGITTLAATPLLPEVDDDEDGDEMDEGTSDVDDDDEAGSASESDAAETDDAFVAPDQEAGAGASNVDGDGSVPEHDFGRAERQTGRRGNANAYKLKDETTVVVSQAEIFAWRAVGVDYWDATAQNFRDLDAMTVDKYADGTKKPHLSAITFDEFVSGWKVIKMNDKEQECTKNNVPFEAHSGGGRPRLPRWAISPGCPLHAEYCIVARTKFVMPVLCGDAPPRRPRTCDRGRRDDSARRAHAAYYGTLFAPWSALTCWLNGGGADDGARQHIERLISLGAPAATADVPKSSWREWNHYRDELDNIAFGEDTLKRVVRLAANGTEVSLEDRTRVVEQELMHGRLFRIDNTIECLSVDKTAVNLATAWRNRCRTRWTDAEKEAAARDAASSGKPDTAAEQEIRIARLKSEACVNPVARMNMAIKEEAAIENLVTQVKSTAVRQHAPIRYRS